MPEVEHLYRREPCTLCAATGRLMTANARRICPRCHGTGVAYTPIAVDDGHAHEPVLRAEEWLTDAGARTWHTERWGLDTEDLWDEDCFCRLCGAPATAWAAPSEMTG